MSTAIVRLPLARTRRAAVAGVCGGVARHLGWGVTTTRVVALALVACGGAGVLLYAWLWALVPLEAPDAADAEPAIRRTVPVAAVLAGVAACWALVAIAQRGSAPALTAVAAIAAASVCWTLVFDPVDPTRPPRYAFVVRMAALAVLALTGAAVLVERPSTTGAVLAVALLALAALGVAAPIAVTQWRSRLAERSAHAREEQRAEIAAHLHDSVLQTLALIQNRADPSSEVARIARAQERELREWLFTGDAPVAEDLVTELREIAATIELEQAVRIDVVAAGEGAPAIPAVVGAAREAMLNAAHHVGGTVSVYIECSPEVVDVFVRDRGPGVDLASLPADRLGIRESILGRMTRAGGTATVRSGPGGTGTEVHLHAEVPR